MKPKADATLRKIESIETNTAPSLAELVAEHPFFKGMRPAHLVILVECALMADFKKGEMVFREGAPANRFYLIRSGRVELESEIKERDPMLIQTIGPGDVLGWSWLFSPYHWRFDAHAATPVKAIVFYGTRLREQCEQDPVFGYELMKRTAEVVIKRLQAARKYLVELRTENRV